MGGFLYCVFELGGRGRWLGASWSLSSMLKMDNRMGLRKKDAPCHSRDCLCNWLEEMTSGTLPRIGTVAAALLEPCHSATHKCS